MTDDIRVLLVDDHATMRAGFRMILEGSGITVAGEAATGAEAVARAAELRPDVVCMDVQMPDMDGIEATRRIVRAGTAAHVVIVTTFDRDDYLFSALDAGASGFLLKNAGPEELVGAVRVVATGDALLAPEVTRRVIERHAAAMGDAGDPGPGPGGGVQDGGPRTGAEAPAPGTPGAGSVSGGETDASDAAAATLTDREREVLRLLAQAMSNAEIARTLFIGEATVKTHVSNVLLKLGARDRVAAVVYAHRHRLA